MHRIIVCKDCGNEFEFTEEQQAFYADMGFFTEPQRCKKCRDARKLRSSPKKKTYEIVCVRCGGIDNVPFEPSHDRPVYCHKCHKENAAQ